MYVQYLMYTICNVQNNTHHQSVCGILLCVFVYCKRLLNTCDSNIQITSVTVPADQLPGYNNIIIPIISHHTLSQLTGSYSPLIVSISLWRSSPNSPLTATCFSPHILPPRMGTQTYWHTLHQQGVCLRGLVCKPVEGVCVCVWGGGVQGQRVRVGKPSLYPITYSSHLCTVVSHFYFYACYTFHAFYIPLRSGNWTDTNSGITRSSFSIKGYLP